ncbi:MAG: 30S ribosomal protein S20 [Deltaproteobacteria bacterium]|nr:30S ribosomal protein S20 [Deltaproteobacteria bacterium]
MANHPSALKRQRQNEKRYLRNKSYKSAIKTYIKKTFESIEEKDLDAAKDYYKQAIAKLDSAVNKGILHRRTASRRISKLTKKVSAVIS